MIRLRVQEVAREKGMSMRRLVRESGIAYNTLRTLYRDPTRTVNTVTLARLAKALGVPSRDLIEDIPDP